MLDVTSGGPGVGNSNSLGIFHPSGKVSFCARSIGRAVISLENPISRYLFPNWGYRSSNITEIKRRSRLFYECKITIRRKLSIFGHADDSRLFQIPTGSPPRASKGHHTVGRIALWVLAILESPMRCRSAASILTFTHRCREVTYVIFGISGKHPTLLVRNSRGLPVFRRSVGFFFVTEYIPTS